MNRKLKTYCALSVLLPRVPARHRANNGNCQFTILCQTTSVKRLAEILGNRGTYSLTVMGCHVTDNPEHIAICQKPETVYYHMENHNPNSLPGEWRAWLEYNP